MENFHERPAELNRCPSLSEGASAGFMFYLVAKPRIESTDGTAPMDSSSQQFFANTDAVGVIAFLHTAFARFTKDTLPPHERQHIRAKLESRFSADVEQKLITARAVEAEKYALSLEERDEELNEALSTALEYLRIATAQTYQDRVDLFEELVSIAQLSGGVNLTEVHWLKIVAGHWGLEVSIEPRE